MSKSFFETKRWKTIMNFIYGIGAAVVIVGALFKILHWPGANGMLMVGLFTEAGIFIISAFEPVHMDPDWSLVYPELAGMESDRPKALSKSSDGSVSQQLDALLESNNIGSDLIFSLGTGLKSLSTNVSEMSQLTNATVATNEYTSNVQKASKTMAEISDSSTSVNSSLNNFNGGLTNILTNLSETEGATIEYASNVQKASKTMAEISDSSTSVNSSLNNFSGGLNNILSNLSETEGTTLSFKEEMSKLNRNLTSLNSIYGGMLSAMGAAKN